MSDALPPPEGADPIEGLAAPPSRHRGSRRRRKVRKDRKSRGRLIAVIAGAAVLAVLAVTAGIWLFGTSTVSGKQPPTEATVHEADQVTEVLGKRETDPRPLSENEVFTRGGEELESQGITFALKSKDITEDCASAVWGPRVTAAVEAAECSQVVRGGYVADDYLGMAALFKLRDTAAAKELAASLVPGEDEADNGFVLVPKSEGAGLAALGAGYSEAQVTVNGHYLVVVWTQSKDSTSPEQPEDLTDPLLSLSNFDFPLYRRMLEHEETGGAAQSGDTPAPGQGGTGAGTGTGTGSGAGTGTGTGTGVGQEGAQQPGAGGV